VKANSASEDVLLPSLGPAREAINFRSRRFLEMAAQIKCKTKMRTADKQMPVMKATHRE
jgi:hypothetical protein